MNICVVGSGMGGSIVVNELAKNPIFNIVVVDCDYIDHSFNNSINLDKLQDDKLAGEVTTGYGYGGTSNLWHGVLTTLDKEDWSQINKICGRNISDEWIESAKNLDHYFNYIDLEKMNHPAPLETIKSFLNTDTLIPKNYYVQKFPFRSRKLIKEIVTSNKNVRLLEGAIAISLDTNSNGVAEKLRYMQEGILGTLEADLFIIAAGALESPRFLQQSAGPNFPLPFYLGKGLMDHPHAIIGKLTLAKKVFYKSHGGTSSSLLSPYRTGLLIKPEARRTKYLNHSIFLRPHLGDDHIQWRENIKALVQEKISLSLIARIVFFKDIFSTLLVLLAEKFGFGIYTDQIAVSVQLEQAIDEGGELVLSEAVDKYQRMIPEIKRCFPQDHLDDINAIHSLMREASHGDTRYQEYSLSFSDLSSGAHHSGTCRMGEDVRTSVVDPNLKYHGCENVYVCDASIIPKIGNANLSLTIGGFAIRLAQHLIKEK